MKGSPSGFTTLLFHNRYYVDMLMYDLNKHHKSILKVEKKKGVIHAIGPLPVHLHPSSSTHRVRHNPLSWNIKYVSWHHADPDCTTASKRKPHETSLEHTVESRRDWDE